MMAPKISRKALEAWNSFAMSLGTLSNPVPYEEVVWNG